MTGITRSRLIFVLITALLFTGCQVLPTPAKVTLYAIPVQASPDATAQTATTLEKSLKLAIPGTSDALSGNRLMVKDDSQGLTAFAGARWESTVPQLWHDYLHQRLLADSRFPVVSTAGEGFVTDWILMGTLRDFQLATANDSTRVVIRYDALVISSKSRKHVASRSFAVQETVKDTEAPTVVAGFGRGADQLSDELLNWLMTLPSK